MEGDHGVVRFGLIEILNKPMAVFFVKHPLLIDSEVCALGFFAFVKPDLFTGAIIDAVGNQRLLYASINLLVGLASPLWFALIWSSFWQPLAKLC